MKGCPKCGKRFEEEILYCPDDGEPLAELTATTPDPLIGKTLDQRYVIESKLGEGGMGLVYLATHAVIQKKCAVKVLRNEVTKETAVAERFIQEARSAAAIADEHVIEITDFGKTPDGNPYFVMEYLDGDSLQELLVKAPVLELERALNIAAQCCDALDAAHAVGVIHRDLKPENLILVTRGGNSDFVKILDFGIAKVARETGRLTRTGAIFGTPQYMAPEQAAGTEIDARVDIYALGIILYEMLCGRVPFEADTFMGVLTKHLYEPPVPPSEIREKGLSRSVESIILKALSKKPDRRYSSMRQMGDDLRAALRGEIPLAATEERHQSTLPPSPAEVVGARASKKSRRHPNATQRVLLGLFGAGALIAIIAFFFLRSKELPPATLPPKVVVPAAPAPELPEEAAPESTAVLLDSTPQGAVLYRGDDRIGQLPITIPRPESVSAGDTYRITLDGYRDLDVLVTAAMPDKFVVSLEAAKTPPSAAKEPSPAPDDKPKPQKKPKKKRRKRRVSGDIMDPWN